jgi:hypothetical protein
VIPIERTASHRDRLLGPTAPRAVVTPPNRRHFNAKQSSHSDLCKDSLNEIAANFEFEGWTVRRVGGGALVLEHDDKAFRVEVREEQ